MRKIFKYKFSYEAKQHLVMPAESEILSVQIQEANVCLWALVDETFENVERTFHIIGTGCNMPETIDTDLIYLQTVQVGMFVWHIFEEVRQ